MSSNLFDTLHEVVETVSSSSDSDVVIIRKKDTGEQFLLKSLKRRPDTGKGEIDQKIRFKRELDIVSSLDHPNIAKPAFSSGNEQSHSIAYPYRQGKTLASLMAYHPAFFPLEALHFSVQILNALEYIHTRGIIHCDVNPNNLYIDDSKGLLLLDFGMSMTEDDAANCPEGSIIGTLPYLSPEQMGFTGFKIDTRSDLYCAGLILYRLLAEKLPFNVQNNTIEELLNQSLRTEVQPIRKIPSVLNGILLKALKPTPGDRYQTATGFKHDLLSAIEVVKTEKQDAFIPGLRDGVIAISRSRLFVARSREVDALADGHAQLLQGRPVSFCLYGKSGIGKTEIVREFRRMTPENESFYIIAKCNTFTLRQPYSIFRHSVLEYIGKINKSSREQIEAFSAAISTQLSDYSGVICKNLPEMRQFFREVQQIDIVEPEKEADRTAHVLFSLFSMLCSFKPLVLFVDDLQWIDRVSFEIIRRMLKSNTPCMLITTYRTENYEGSLRVFEYDLRSLTIQKFIPIMTFTRPEIKDLIISRFGNVSHATELTNLLASKTDCSPFALTEALRFLVINSFLNLDKDGWSHAQLRPEDLPDKLDPIELILDKIKDLTTDELRWLETASLAEGKFQTSLVEHVSDFSSAESSIIIENLENRGLLVPQFGGGYCFTHDRIQESVHSNIPKDKQYKLYEKYGIVYEQMSVADKTYLFFAAESYLKSKNLTKAIELCYSAAKHAAETVALDVASRYFSTAYLMITQSKGVIAIPPIDVVKMQIEYGDVLMLTGRNEQALKMFNGALSGIGVLDRMVVLDIKYKIGTIYHNMGDFETSINFFKDSLSQLKINFHSNKIFLVGAFLVEVAKQSIFSLGFKSILLKNNNPENIFAVKLFNKLCYSLYFKNVLLSQFAHFKALNIAESLIDCAEKAEAYSYHIVSSFVLMLKKRAFSYFYKAIRISNNINRKDALGLAQAFGGITYNYNASWNNAEKHLEESIQLYKLIGDLWGQIVPLETKVLTSIKRGEFPAAKLHLNDLMVLDNECNDRRGLALSHYLLTYIRHLEGNDSYLDWATVIEERDSVLSKSHMNKTMSNLVIEAKFILDNQLMSAFALSNEIVSCINANHLLQEYVANAFSDRCEILVRELYNRYFARVKERQIELSDRNIYSHFRKSLRSAFLRGIMYPAHLGSSIRAYAWYNAFKKRNRIARFLFKKAITHHHRLDMKYEEAKSIRDFALFYEIINEPGLARDHFNKAYILFDKCGAMLETSRIEEKVDPDILKRRKEPLIIRDTSTGSFDAADQIRVDALYDASLQLAKNDTVEALLRQTVHSLIKATGAQYGLLHLDGDEFHEPRELVLNFEDREIARETISPEPDLMDRTRKERQVVIVQTARREENLPDNRGSALCVPLMRGEKYFGCVYLTNTLVSGLFSESASKAAQIIAGQASFLIENRYLMEEYKRLNVRLEQKVKEQTSDIREKHDQLSASNLKLIESERMKDLLTGTIVHDIKNFAAGISGNIRLLSYKYKEDLRTLRSIDLVVESCTDIVNLASNLLDMSKMEEGRLTLQQRQLYFEELAAIAQKFGRNVLFDEKKITVTIIPPKGDFVVMADPYLVERVIQNLFSNAAKYTNAGGNVAFSFEETGEENILSFTSSGPIIPDDQKSVIFEKYSRVDGKQSQYSKGLGLFFCKMVMTAHGGRIWLDTDEQGNHFRLGFRKL